MRRVIWSDEAAGNLDDIVHYVEADLSAAHRLADRLISAAEGLEEFSFKGREAAAVSASSR